MSGRCLRLGAAVAIILAGGSSLSGCEHRAAAPAKPTETGDAFVERLNHEIADVSHEQAVAGFAYATYINQDTEFLNAKANERYLEYFGRAVEQAKTHEKEQLSPASARTIQLLKLGVAAPAPADAAKRTELAGITSKM